MAILDAVRGRAPEPASVEGLPGVGDRRRRLVDALAQAGLLDRIGADTVVLTSAAEGYFELLDLELPQPSPAST
jgi:hypothetical protein